ncbi:MAG: non-ribosomal peptide synthetase [Frankiaceae bacterium]
MTSELSIEDKRRAALELRRRQRLAGRDEFQPLVRVDRGVGQPLSWQQEGLWFLHELDRSSVTYALPVGWRLTGPLWVEALEESLRRLVERHEALRTRFDAVDGVPRQVVDPVPERWSLPMADLGDVPAEQRWDRAVELAREQAWLPFDLRRGPVFRAWLCRLADDDHVLVWTIHHVCTDGWSVGILTRELRESYEALCAGRELVLPELRVQPVDHAVWQRSRMSGAALEQALGHWEQRLTGLPELAFPSDRPRPAQPLGLGDGVLAMWSVALGRRIREVAAQRGVPVLAVLLAGFGLTLRRWCGQEDLAIGSVLSGRTHSDTEPMVGMFVSTVVLRTDASGDPTFAELMDRCAQTVLDALAHQDVPLRLVVERLRPPRRVGVNPLFQVCLSYLPAALSGEDPRLGQARIGPVPTGVAGARFDVRVEVVDHADGGMHVWVEYASELFDAARLQRLVACFEEALAAGLAEPHARTSQLEVLPADMRALVVREWNATERELGDAGRYGRPVPETIARRAAASPDAVAVACEGVELSYAQLLERADRMASFLRERGVGAGSLVAVACERSVELMVALVGVLRAGAGYLPLDTEAPAARQRLLLADAGAPVVLTQAALADRLPRGDWRVVALDADWPTIAGCAPAPLPEPAGDDVAYLLYTSGSTGAPKGVMVEHAGLANRLWWMQDAYPIGPGDVVLQKTPCTFDVSVWELFWPLMMGARLELARPGGHRDPVYLAELIRRAGVSVVHFVPSVLRRFLAELPPIERADDGGLPSLRHVVCSGETLPADLRDRLFERIARAALHNLYGPTEAAIDVTAHTCRRDERTPAVPIGAPIANMRCYVLDAGLHPVPIGVPGELYLAGIGLARGYLHRPDLTAERFVPCPFGPPGTRMYATGDLARWTAAGELEHLGRTDAQIKLHGQRIEPGEIEHALQAVPGIAAAAVVLVDSDGGPGDGGGPDGAPDGARLHAYLVGPGVPADDQLRARLAESLPLHMIPASYQRLDALPLTTSGKLDRRALPDPTVPAADSTEPTTDTQRALRTIWAEILNLDPGGIGPATNFFTLGGSSLDLIRLRSEIHRQLSITIEPRSLFLAATLTAMAGTIDEEVAGLAAEVAELSEEELDRLLEGVDP